MVAAATVTPASGGLSPTVTLRFAAAAGLTLGPGQGCVQCCNQTAKSDWPGVLRPGAVFELANRRGVWLPAVGQLLPGGGGVLVSPAGHARNVSNDWVAAVRYAMIDEPQCVLYNGERLPALPFELPVPWQRPA